MAMPIPSPIDGYVKDGLILAYDGYQEPSGGKWKDLSSSHNDLVLASDVAYDSSTHKLTFTTTNSVTTAGVPIDADGGVTIEVVGGFTAKNQSWFQGVSDWPYSPKITLSTDICIQFPTSATETWQSAYAEKGGWFMSRDTIDGAMQFAMKGTSEVSEINGLCNPDESWDRRPSVTQTTTFVPCSYNLQFNDAFIRALRIYNRRLTTAELLQNRLLDASRFDLSTTNIQ